MALYQIVTFSINIMTYFFLLLSYRVLLPGNMQNNYPYKNGFFYRNRYALLGGLAALGAYWYFDPFNQRHKRQLRNQIHHTIDAAGKTLETAGKTIKNSDAPSRMINSASKTIDSAAKTISNEIHNASSPAYENRANYQKSYSAGDVNSDFNRRRVQQVFSAPDNRNAAYNNEAWTREGVNELRNIAHGVVDRVADGTVDATRRAAESIESMATNRR